MKNTIYLLLLILLVSAVSVNAEYTYISDSDILTASLVNQDPDPAIAGNIIELRIGVENWGAKPAEGYELQLELKYPFEAVPGEEYVQSTGTLQGFQTESDQKILKFKLRTNKEASEGSYDLDILLYKSGEKDLGAIKKTLSVDVKNRESAEVIYIDKVKLIPGQQTPIQFTINNVGAAPLRDLSFSWSNEDDIILPVGSSDTKYIKYLGIGEKVTIIYDAIADTNANPGLYKLKLSLTYEDSVTGELTQVTNNAGVYVGGETDFDVSFSESSSGEISFSVANIGSNPAYSVSVIIPEQQGWRTSGPNSVIIGNLNKGDYTVASFNLQRSIGGREAVQTPAPGEETDLSDEQLSELKARRAQLTESGNLQVEIAYTDTMGNREIVKKEVALQATMMNSNSTELGARRAGMMSRSGQSSLTSQIAKVIYYALGAAAVLLFFLGFRRYKNRKSERENINGGNTKVRSIKSLNIKK